MRAAAPSSLPPLAPAAPLFGDNRSRAILADLSAKGWAHAPAALDEALWHALRDEALALAEEGCLKAGKVGRGAKEAAASDVRRAQIAWLTGATPAQRAFLLGCEALRLDINRALFAGLFEFEAHFAVYPQGGFYKRHLDAFAPGPGAAAHAGLGRAAGRSRVVSLVAFLNEDWREDDGGALALWDAAPARADLSALDAVPPAAVIRPEGGGLVLMLSEEIPHEVRIAHRQRLALAGWFRVNASIGGVVDVLG